MGSYFIFFKILLSKKNSGIFETKPHSQVYGGLKFDQIHVKKIAPVWRLANTVELNKDYTM